jgi:hypothetical protein
METLVSIFSNLSCSENSLAAAQKISDFFQLQLSLAAPRGAKIFLKS